MFVTQDTIEQSERGTGDDQSAAAADWLRKVHPNVRQYWTDPSELSQLMASGEVLVAWSWNDAVAILQSEGFPIGFNRAPKEGASSFFCGYVNMKDAPGSEDKAYDFINAWLTPATAARLLASIGYSLTDDAAMATIPDADRVKGFADAVNGTLLAQTPIKPEIRDRMLSEFEKIKAGF